MEKVETGGDARQPNQPAGRDSRSGLTGLQRESPQESDIGKSKEQEHETNYGLGLHELAAWTMFDLVWGLVRKDTSSTDWLIVILTAVIAGTSYLQWREIRAGSSDTHDLAVAAGEQVKKMKDMSDAANKIREAAEGMVTQEQRIADNAQKALDGSNKQSKAALDASINQFRDEQRAWVGFPLGEVTDDIAVGKSPKGLLRLQNNGRTPAIKVASETQAGVICGGFPRRPPYTVPETDSLMTIMPGAPPINGYPVNLVTDSLPLKEKDLLFTKVPGCELYIYGKVTYSDTFSRLHWQHYCASWKKGTPRDFLGCSFYNDGDQDYKDGKEPN